MTAKTMDFIESPLKVNKRAVKNKISEKSLEQFSTGRIMWHLAKRHKFGLVSSWAFIITVLWAFPPATDILVSLVIGR